MADVAAIVRCPTCKRTSAWSTENLYRPFCCERCRLIDLGAWFAESHRIAGEPIGDQDLLPSVDSPERVP